METRRPVMKLSDLIQLLSCCGDEFSAKGGSSGVKGRLQSSFNFWVETLDAPDFVLDMIRRRVPLAVLFEEQ